MNLENDAIGLRIRNLREKQKLSREKLAELSGISTQFLADIETGKKGMTVNTLKKICNALHVTSDYIVYGTDKSGFSDIESMLNSLSIDKIISIKEIICKIIEII